MEPSDLNDLEKETLAALSKSPDLDSLTKGVDALKSIADIRLTRETPIQTSNAFKVQRVQAWAALLVPIASVLALVATVAVQTAQLAATANAANQQREDTEWRDLLSSLKGRSDVVYNDVTIAPRLQSFAESPRYGSETKAIAARLMGHLSNPDGFDDLFSYVFGAVNTGNVVQVIIVSKELRASQRELEGRCPAGYDCDRGIEPLPANHRLTANDRTVIALSNSLSDLYVEQQTVSQKLSDFIRANGAVGLNLSNASIASADLSGIDFTKADITNAILDRVRLDGATLDISKFKNAEFRESNWWDARQISTPLLIYAIHNYNPWYARGVTLLYPITTAQYRAKVARLCQASGLTCNIVPVN